MYILSVIRQSIVLLTKKQKVYFVLLLGFFLIGALIQVLGVASIGPFVAVLSKPEIITTNSKMKFIYDLLGSSSNTEFIIAIAFASLFMMVFSNLISVFTLWLLMRFSVSFGGSLQSRLYESMLKRSYLFHKSTNYTDLISTVTQEAPRFMYMVQQPILLLFSNIFVSIIILVGLIALNPLMAFSIGAMLGITYLLTYVFLKKSLSKYGAALTERSSAKQKILSESFVGIKDVKLNGLESRFSSKFKTMNNEGLEASTFIALSGDIPKYIIETISFSAIFIFAIFTLKNGTDPASIVPLMSLYAIAGYKLLPSVQQVYKSASTISAHGSVVFNLVRELQYPVVENTQDANANVEFGEINKISVSNISFSYPGANRDALANVNLLFEKGKINTIAGHSGSGKSTLVDVLLGLLKPSGGHIKINDDLAEGDAYFSLQKVSGFVPQQIFIIDDTVIANVAFGEDPKLIDINRVNKALEQANALGFVQKLPKGIYSNLGQDGKMLSGGQKQRIGIARALYKKTKLLILDEPTSALDIESEYDFMLLLKQLKSEVLVVVISHRPSAIKLSDSIALISDGEVECQGSFSELKTTNKQFQEMLEKSMIE